MSAKVLYLYNTKTTWTENDYEKLSRHFTVTQGFIHTIGDQLRWVNPFRLSSYDVVITWFASLSFLPIALMARLLHKGVVIIAGGYDVVRLPEINYGAWTQNPISRVAREIMFHLADTIVSVSQSNQHELIENVRVSAERSIMLYHGFEDPVVVLRSFDSRQKRIVTIGEITNSTLTRKGYDSFLKLAELMPDWDFWLIGKVDPKVGDWVDQNVGNNVSVPGYVSDESLKEILNDTRFYVQLSVHEGFGVSIVDSALMGCYPIVFDRFAMPEVVAGCGTVIEFGHLNDVKDAILSMNTQSINVEEIRQFYLAKFPSINRENGLCSVVNALVSPTKRSIT